LAKATTNKDRRLAARSRAARTPLVDDEALREGESDPADESMMNDESAFDDDEIAEDEDALEAEAADDADAVPQNALPSAFASDQALMSTADRTALRTYTVPDWTLGNPFTRFIAESYIELRKVTWPTWREAWNWTLVVIAMSAVIALILAASDLGLSRLLTWLVGLSAK
jgi:preprotein translocase SecE subunit